MAMYITLFINSASTVFKATSMCSDYEVQVYMQVSNNLVNNKTFPFSFFFFFNFISIVSR